MKNKLKKQMIPLKQNFSVDEAAGKLFNDIRSMIDAARNQVSRAVNTGLVMLYWHIGDRIRKNILRQERAQYGEKIVATVSQQLTAVYGKGYTRTALSRMINFAEKYPKKEIVAMLSQQLGWSHFVELIPIKDKLKRDFYAEMCRIERWSVETLRKKIGGMLFERTALSKKPRRLAEMEIKALKNEDYMTPDMAFRDPYFLDFLGLKDTFNEKDLESAIIKELERFLVEIGTDFSFIARQKRIIVDGEDFYIDLLFYHRRLRRLVAIELKMDKFRPQDKGQVELYLRWLEKYEMRPGENKPIGLVLCAAKKYEQIELLELDKSGIRVSEYWTALPPRNIFKEKLHEMVELGRKLYENRNRGIK